MLHQIFSRPEALARLRTGALRAEIDDFVGDMLVRGHTIRTIEQYV